MDQLSTKPSLTRSPWILEVIAGLSWTFRLSTIKTLSKDWTHLAHDSTLDQFFCERLSKENGVYCPSRPLPAIGSWKKMFTELFPLRNMWQASSQHILYRAAFEEREARERFATLCLNADDDDTAFDYNLSLAEQSHASSKVAEVTEVTEVTEATIAPPVSRYNVEVSVRFRPTKQLNSKQTKQEQLENKRLQVNKSRFLLPLHQRLQIIKVRDGCTTKTALKTLSKEGAWFDQSWKKKSIKDQHDDKENGNDFGAGGQEARVQSVDTGTGSVIMIAPSIGMRPFTFDRVLEGRSTQSTSYDLTTKHLVIDMLNGFNASVIMYGQTGSGKTWTCFGPSPSEASYQPKNRGLVQRACEEIFQASEQRKKLGINSNLSVSYVEVYGNEVTDLLKNGERVGHNKVSSQRYVLSGQAKQVVTNLNDIYKALSTGDLQKRRAATAMNDRSSRAHSLFVVTMEMFNIKTGVRMKSELYLADLGGSEQVKKSKVHHGGIVEGKEGLGFQMGENFKEAVNINLGLLALKKCISALNEGSEYIPYQDSKLTMLLSNGIGGDSRATVLVCASPENENAVETLQALRFGEKCRAVVNEAGQNQNAIQDIIESMDKEIKMLEETIVKKERWESREVVRTDTLVEQGTYEAKLQEEKGGEIVKTGVICGAEEERARLEKVIIARAELTGEDFQLKLEEAGLGNTKYLKHEDIGNKRFNDEDDTGLKIKGKKVAGWVN